MFHVRLSRFSATFDVFRRPQRASLTSEGNHRWRVAFFNRREIRANRRFPTSKHMLDINPRAVGHVFARLLFICDQPPASIFHTNHSHHAHRSPTCFAM